jgi:heptosyltransferase-1
MSDRDQAAVRRARRILIIKPSSLGDIVHALPVLAGVRAVNPHAHVAWLAGSAFVGLLDQHPLLDEVIPFDRHRFGRMLRERAAAGAFLRFVRDLRERRFDLVIDLQGLVRSGFLSWACGAGRRVGFAEAREFGWVFYNRRVRSPRHAVHAVDRNRHVARQLGLPVDPPRFPLGLSGADHQAAAAQLVDAGLAPETPLLAIVPGARWVTKRWPAAHWAALLNQLHADGLPTPVILGGPGDRDFVDDMVASAAVPVVDLVGATSLRELAALLARAALVVCHDSGPMHVAAALDRPLVALFGPTNPARTGPYAARARVVARDLDCMPCYRRQCPLDHHDCLRVLSVDVVARAVRESWTGEPTSPPAALPTT